jgi:nucleoside diphosphate kinase
MMLKLSKNLTSKEKIDLIRKELINEIKQRPELKLTQIFTEDVLNTIEEYIKPKYEQNFNINKLEFAIDIITEGHQLNDVEKQVLKEQINFIISKKLIKKIGRFSRIVKRVSKLFF